MEIHKYKLHTGGEQIIKIPQGAKILCVQKQGDDYSLWAEIDTNANLVPRTIVAYCTGEEICNSPFVEAKYISTVQDGWFVVHFYDLGEY